MGDYRWTPDNFDGTDINDASYESKFLHADNIGAPPDFEPIEIETPGSYPTSPRSQPQSRVLPLNVHLLAHTQTALNNFKKLFDAEKGDCILKAQDGDGSTWRLTVRILGVPEREDAPSRWVVRLYAPRPVWEQDSAQSDVQTATTSPKIWQVTNAGTKRAYPVFQLKPTVAKAHTADYLRRWPVSIAWRSELEGLSTDGLPYPIDVANDALNTDAENTAGRLQSDLDDLRVLVNGTEVRRDPDPATDDTTTKVWCSIPFKPMLRATAAVAMTLISPANGESFSVSDPGGLSLWPESGFVLVDSECLYYGARSDTAFQQVLRGSRGTTIATHSAGAYLYRVQHDIQIISDYTVATEPNGSDVDRKPIIDLALSTNLKHVYAGPFTAIGTYRSGQWLREYTNDNLLSPAISFLDGATPAFRDIAPSAAAPKFNGLELYVPCGVKAAAGAIEHDIIAPNDMRLRLSAGDFEGLESVLATYDPNNDGVGVTVTPASVLSRLRYNAVLPVLLGAPSRTPVYDYIVGSFAGAKKAQGFSLTSESWITGLILTFKKVTAPDGNVVVTLNGDVSGDPDPTAIITFGNFAASTLGTSYTPLLLLFATAMPPGTYHLVIYRSVLTGGTVYLAGQDRNFAAGFVQSGDGAGGWNDVPYDCLNFAVLTRPESDVQANTRQGEGNSITIDNIELTFDNTTPRTPLIVRGAQETIYFLRGVLKCDDTGAEITVACPLALNDILEIDPYNKTVKRIPASAADPTEDVPWACAFSDEIDWAYLPAGVSNWRWTEAGVGTVVITTTWRGAWA
jgi:hypothetical protein